MFLINIRPLRTTKTIEDYATLLFNQVVVGYFQLGTTEVHLVFDKPGSTPFNPKAFEHRRRYNKHTLSSQYHQHIDFTPTVTVWPKWQDYLLADPFWVYWTILSATRKATIKRKIGIIRVFLRSQWQWCIDIILKRHSSWTHFTISYKFRRGWQQIMEACLPILGH